MKVETESEKSFMAVEEPKNLASKKRKRKIKSNLSLLYIRGGELTMKSIEVEGKTVEEA